MRCGRADAAESASSSSSETALAAAEAEAKNGKSLDEINPIIDDARNRFIQLAQKMGLSADEANNLADRSGISRDAVDRLTQAVNNVPTQHNTNLTATDNATPVIRNVRDMLLGLKDKTVTLNQVVNYMSTGDLPSASGPLASGYKKVSKASGGLINGPGTGTSDDIPAKLSNGEYVVRAAAVKQYGVEMLNAINWQRYAAGGPVSKYEATPMPAARYNASEGKQVVYNQYVTNEIHSTGSSRVDEALLSARVRAGTSAMLQGRAL